MNTNTDLKGSSFTLPVLHLAGKDLEQDIAFLTQKVEQAPGFFTNAPVVLNIEAVEGEIDFEQLKSGVLRAGMIPVGIAGCKTARSRTQAADAGLAVMNSSKTATREQVPITPVKVIRTPVRSGQQIYAKDGDLLVLSHVSAGAEVIADGSIHIHGTLRGRAIAGASGQKEARIICHDLQAELVSVNGNYWLSDQIDSGFWQKKVMVSLTDDQLQLDVLSI